MRNSYHISRLPLIRHIRFLWHAFWLHLRSDQWASRRMGCGILRDSDLDRLEMILEGKA